MPLADDLLTAYHRVHDRIGEAGWQKLPAHARQKLIDAEMRAIEAERLKVCPFPPEELLREYIRQKLSN